jgi:hypothetical protein
LSSIPKKKRPRSPPWKASGQLQGMASHSSALRLLKYMLYWFVFLSLSSLIPALCSLCLYQNSRATLEKRQDSANKEHHNRTKKRKRDWLRAARRMRMRHFLKANSLYMFRHGFTNTNDRG